MCTLQNFQGVREGEGEPSALRNKGSICPLSPNSPPQEALSLKDPEELDKVTKFFFKENGGIG